MGPKSMAFSTPLTWTGPQHARGRVLRMERPNRLYVMVDETALFSRSHQLLTFTLEAPHVPIQSFTGQIESYEGPLLILLFSACDLERFQAFLGQLRKNEHLDLCQREDVEASDRFTGFDAFSFLPHAISDIAMKELDTQSTFLGHRFASPFLITGMTGGVSQGHEINRRLAQVACARGIPMGIGSQRVALEDPSCRAVFQLKKEFPDLFLIGNLGVAQLLQPQGVDWCQQAVDMVGADALALHLNVMQECVQTEG